MRKLKVKRFMQRFGGAVDAFFAGSGLLDVYSDAKCLEALAFPTSLCTLWKGVFFKSTNFAPQTFWSANPDDVLFNASALNLTAGQAFSLSNSAQEVQNGQNVALHGKFRADC